jgi:hypothetical protein
MLRALGGTEVRQHVTISQWHAARQPTGRTTQPPAQRICCESVPMFLSCASSQASCRDRPMPLLRCVLMRTSHCCSPERSPLRLLSRCRHPHAMALGGQAATTTSSTAVMARTGRLIPRGIACMSAPPSQVCRGSTFGRGLVMGSRDGRGRVHQANTGCDGDVAKH